MNTFVFVFVNCQYIVNCICWWVFYKWQRCLWNKGKSIVRVSKSLLYLDQCSMYSWCSCSFFKWCLCWIVVVKNNSFSGKTESKTKKGHGNKFHSICPEITISRTNENVHRHFKINSHICSAQSYPNIIHLDKKRHFIKSNSSYLSSTITLIPSKCWTWPNP